MRLMPTYAFKLQGLGPCDAPPEFSTETGDLEYHRALSGKLMGKTKSVYAHYLVLALQSLVLPSGNISVFYVV